MKKPPFEKQIHFQGSKVSEVNRQNLDEDFFLSTGAEEGTCSRIRMSTTSQKHEFSYHKVPTQIPVVDVLPLPAKYFRQIPRKDIPSKNKAPIEEGVKAEDILDRMLEGEMKVTPKELWAVVPKMQMALKEILTSKHLVRDELNQDLETDNNQPQCQGCAEWGWSDLELLQSGRELTTKVGEQSWPQLMRCASICCCMCGCLFQEDRIVVRNAGEEWYID